MKQGIVQDSKYSRRRWRSGLIGLLSLGLLATAAAQEQRWTLERCIERAVTTSPEVNESQAEVRIAESQLSQAKAGRLPKATFTSINGIVNGATGNAVTGRTDNSDLGPFSKGELEVVQPLYTFGLLSSSIRAASHGVEAKRAATQNARAATIAQVKELYYNLLLSRQVKELIDEVQENFTKALATAEKRLEAGEGTITQQDLLKLRIGLASVSKEVYTLERAIAVTRGALMRQVGLPLDSAFELAETRLEPVTLQLHPLAHYLQQAGVHRADILQLEAGLAARQARLVAARSAYYPSIFIAGGLRYAKAPNRENQESPFANDEFNFFNGGAALGLRWQLDMWMTSAKVDERLAELSQVETQKQNATSGIALDIQRRYLEVQEAQHKIDSAQTARKAARALLATTLANFELGIGEGKEVFDNLGLYTRIVSDYHTVVRDYNIAAAKLTQATGQEVTTLTYQR
ncbi:MAG: TolC family protein [Candidatus Tectimicrobiota bacterium]